MGNRNSGHPVLIGQAGPLNGNRWTVHDALMIGRDSSCEIVIPDRHVSRFHIRLDLSDEMVTVEDLGSKNGTFINNIQVATPTPLKDGDDLSIAYIQQFVFLSSDSTLPLDSNLLQHGRRKNRLFVDPKSRRVWINEKEVLPPLSVPQFRMLQMLYHQPGTVVSRQELVLTIWGDMEAVGISEQALDALVRRLRERLTSADPNHEYIITVRGHGIRLENPEI
jgi:DNA-binding winged helix-turn-helix (wHTH) protein